MHTQRGFLITNTLNSYSQFLLGSLDTSSKALIPQAVMQLWFTSHSLSIFPFPLDTIMWHSLSYVL